MVEKVTTPSGLTYEVLDDPPPPDSSSPTTGTRTTTSRRTSTAKKATGRAKTVTVKGISASERNEIKLLFTILLAGSDFTAWELSQAHIPVEGWWTEKDRLRTDESKLLVDAVYAELAQHPELLRKLLGLAKHSAHLHVVGALACIAIPRLANHGLLPPELAKIASYFALQLATLGANSFPVESRTTSNSDSGDGTGEVNANGVAGTPKKVQDSPEIETGRSPVENRTNGVSRVLSQDR